MTHYKAVSTKTVADLLDYSSKVRSTLDRLKHLEASLPQEDDEMYEDKLEKADRAHDDFSTAVDHLVNFIEQMEI